MSSYHWWIMTKILNDSHFINLVYVRLHDLNCEISVLFCFRNIYIYIVLPNHISQIQYLSSIHWLGGFKLKDILVQLTACHQQISYHKSQGTLRSTFSPIVPPVDLAMTIVGVRAELKLCLGTCSASFPEKAFTQQQESLTNIFCKNIDYSALCV